MSGANVESVDIISFGSPCTDMSVAGKRAGLKGNQSVLFYEAIRIIKEMRCATNGSYPRFILWENVPGAFSSNKGGRLQGGSSNQSSKSSEPGVEVPSPYKKQMAIRRHTRGRRMERGLQNCRCAIFRSRPTAQTNLPLSRILESECAGEILFERKGVSRNYSPRFCSREGIAGSAESCARESIKVLNDQGGSCMSVSENITATLRAEEHGHQPIVF